MKDRLNIEFLYWEECPSHAKTWDRLQGVLGGMGLEAQISRIEVKTDEDAQRQGFCGSPTIRINSRDMDLEGAQAQRVGLSCRIYHTPDGRITPVPTEEMILEAIKRELSI